MRKHIFIQQSNQGIKLLCIAVLAVILMFTDNKWHKSVAIKSSLNSVMVMPLVRLVDLPFSGIKQMVQYFSFKSTLLRNYQRLQSQYVLQQVQLQTHESLLQENQQLRKLLHSSVKAEQILSIANLLDVEPDPFTRQAILDKGSQDGVFIGQPVVDADGVIGKIIAVTLSTARLMFLTDASHAIPVENLRNGIRAIAIGTGTFNKLELQHVPNTVDVKVGDVLVTSGLGGKYPTGYKVGVIKEISYEPGNNFATIILVPSAKLEQTRQVVLLANKK